MFIPETALIRREAMDFPSGRAIAETLRQFPATKVELVEGSRLPSAVKGLTPRESFLSSKRTLVVAVRKTLSFQTCKPSAHYQLPLVSSCPGLCEYCYLQTTLGPQPRMTVYVNVEEIFSRAKGYIEERNQGTTFFEGGATGDPIPVEPYTRLLRQAIEFFAAEDLGRLRVATKFDDVDSLLDLDHRGHTHFRFSINALMIVKRFEKGVPSLRRRFQAARLLAESGYPVGFLVAPVFLFPGWEKAYEELARMVHQEMKGLEGFPSSLEFVSHRFTTRAKNMILARNPDTELPMNQEDRVARMGQFGYVKYLYPPARMKEIKQEITEIFSRELPDTPIEYFV